MAEKANISEELNGRVLVFTRKYAAPYGEHLSKNQYSQFYGTALNIMKKLCNRGYFTDLTTNEMLDSQAKKVSDTVFSALFPDIAETLKVSEAEEDSQEVEESPQEEVSQEETPQESQEETVSSASEAEKEVVYKVVQDSSEEEKSEEPKSEEASQEENKEESQEKASEEEKEDQENSKEEPKKDSSNQTKKTPSAETTITKDQIENIGRGLTKLLGKNTKTYKDIVNIQKGYLGQDRDVKIYVKEYFTEKIEETDKALREALVFLREAKGGMTINYGIEVVVEDRKSEEAPTEEDMKNLLNDLDQEIVKEINKVKLKGGNVKYKLLAVSSEKENLVISPLRGRIFIEVSITKEKIKTSGEARTKTSLADRIDKIANSSFVSATAKG